MKLGYFSIGFVLITMGAKLEKFGRDLKKLRHSYMKQPLIQISVAHWFVKVNKVIQKCDFNPFDECKI